jgi:hypothetical protein
LLLLLLLLLLQCLIQGVVAYFVVEFYCYLCSNEICMPLTSAARACWDGHSLLCGSNTPAASTQRREHALATGECCINFLKLS